MDINVLPIFDDYENKLKRIKKKIYIAYMESFCANNADLFNALIDSFENNTNSEEKSVTDEFANQVFDAFSKKGKVKGTVKTELNMFMIIYVFPAFLLTKRESVTDFCDALRNSWNSKFNEKIGYTDYDTMLGGFNDKLFGIF